MFKIFVLFFTLITSLASAKDLTSRLGVGIKNNSAVDLPQLAAFYYPNADVGFTAGLGTDTEENNSKFAFNVGIRRILFKENNMNFYYGGQIGMLNVETPSGANNSDKESGFEMNLVFGAEFFFAGLDSLGFSFEGGVGLSSLDETRFRTVGDHPLKAGLVFYF
jgi:hypothetical protein